MMSKLRRVGPRGARGGARRVGLLAGLLLLCGIPFLAPLRAEVSANGSDPRVLLLVFGIIEGPDPVESLLWATFRQRSPEEEQDLLNPGGSARGDGRPATAFRADTGFPAAVWSYNAGLDHDVAFNEWLGDGWLQEPVFLTSGLTDDLDPRIHCDGATIHVTWWEATTEFVWVVSRPEDSGIWGLPRLVAAAGRRPSVVALGNALLVTYETDAPAGGQKILVATSVAGGPFVAEMVATTPREERLDPVLHFSNGRLWLDWQDSDEAFAFAERHGPQWGPSETVPWNDATWVGAEEIRFLIRNELLSRSE